ncbi:MAG: hypothetical protein EA426_13790 [Spirochaetaceae bacterium]|nr:MAG: hypothetical protein EA426_13790 [Spirochaetaceae bacterium]
MAKRSLDIRFILTILVGAFLVLDGIAGLNRSSSFLGELGRALGSQGSTITMIVAVLALVAGALLILGLFLNLGDLDRFLGIGIFIAWLVVIVLVFFIGRFSPDQLSWWTGLVQYSIILAVIWMVRAQRA